MSMQFVKYPSLTNHTSQKFVQQFHDTLCGQNLLVSEKIHGANLQIMIDKENNIRFGSRNQDLGEFGSFYDLPNLKLTTHQGKTLLERVALLTTKLKDDYLRMGANIENIRLFGEYAGTLTQGNKVQREVDYGQQDFYMFDILLEFQDEELQFVDKLVVRQYAKDFGIATPTLICVTDDLQKALEIRNDFDSISGEHRHLATRQFGVENLKFTGENTAEGFVIEPNVVTRIFENRERAIIKHKNEKFNEKAKDKPIKKLRVLTDEENQALANYAVYITPQRLSNVCSHHGISEKADMPKNFGNLMKWLFEDAVDEMKKDGVDLTMLNKVVGEFRKLCQDEIRTLLLSL